MAVRIDASADMVSRVANLPSSTSYTSCGWAYVVSDRGAVFQSLFSLDNGGSYNAIYWDQTGNGMMVDNGGSGANFGSRPSTGEWFFFAMSSSGTGAGTFNGYWARAQDTSFVTASGAGNSFTPTLAAFGNDGFGGSDWCDCRLAWLKLWDVALTPSELEVERHYGYPVRLANLNVFAPCWDAADAATDYGANKRNMTIGGTLTTEDGPPVRIRRSGPRVSFVASAPTLEITGFDPSPPFTVGQSGVLLQGVGFGAAP